MDESTRTELMDAYFEGMDESDHAVLAGALASDVIYHHPVRTVTGRRAAVELIIDERPPQDSVHDVSRRIHGADASIAEGKKVGTVEGEPVELPFCDVFEFDGDESAITSIAVYVRE
jgi:ketosteroid isomerase-like protein